MVPDGPPYVPDAPCAENSITYTGVFSEFQAPYRKASGATIRVHDLGSRSALTDDDGAFELCAPKPQSPDYAPLVLDVDLPPEFLDGHIVDPTSFVMETVRMPAITPAALDAAVARSGETVNPNLGILVVLDRGIPMIVEGGPTGTPVVPGSSGWVPDTQSASVRMYPNVPPGVMKVGRPSHGVLMIDTPVNAGEVTWLVIPLVPIH